jgi:hypothetical protein
LNWRIIAVLAILAGLLLGFAPVISQASSGTGGPRIFVDHYYSINALGFGVINESITFTNNGTSAVQIPTLQFGLPPKTSARSSGFLLSPSDKFTLSQSQNGGNATLSVAPDNPTLNAGASVTVALKGLVSNVINYTQSGFGGNAPFLILLTPSINMNVSAIKANIVVPPNVSFISIPSGFTVSATNGSLTMTRNSTMPAASERYINLNATQQGAITPVDVTQLSRAIVPDANGAPMVQDRFTIHNLSSFNMTQIHLSLLNKGIESVTELPSSEPPLLNPKILTLSSGTVAFSQANLGSVLFPESNLTLTISYPVPSSLVKVSGSTVTVTVPYSPLIEAPVSNYTIYLQPVKGIVPSGQTAYSKAVNPFTAGSVQFSYSVSVGWAADQAIPAGILVFAVAFVVLAIQRPSTKKEETGRVVRRTPEVLRSFEDKTGLETQYMEQFATAPKGSISRTDFDRMRNEVTELRSRAIQRLNDLKQSLGSGRQYDSLNRVAEAEREEDRAFRDLLNLYVQYHGNRMNEETFRRLQPSYKKRVDAAINRLSDLLHETQSEEK